MSEDFEQRVRDVVLATLRDPGVLPQEFKGWLPRWVETLIEVPRGQVVGAYTTAIDVSGLGAAVHGRPSTVRAGTTPYEFLQMTFDDVYGKWVSSQTWNSTQTAGITISAGSYTDIVFTAFPGFFLPGFRALYDADLRPQVNVAAEFTGGAGGATRYLRAAVYEIADGDTGGLVKIGDGGEITSANTVAEHQVSGWTDITFSAAPTDAHAYLRLQQKISSGSSSATESAISLRWVSS